MLAPVPWAGMFALASDPARCCVGWTGRELTMREMASCTIYLAVDFASTDILHL
uniref:Uncharacterized protein n=1 Tax=Setaria viridis TaxID=4556 RepID=A0A4U6VA42_SETVI|nr:hypothetical protein SEVIR_3G061900v2 [Setaria viridis]